MTSSPSRVLPPSREAGARSSPVEREAAPPAWGNWSGRELATLAKLWPTAIPDKLLEERFGKPRGVIHRAARKYLGLPGRHVARRKAEAGR